MTIAPRLRWNITRPSASRRLRASRTGILLTLNCRAMSSWRIGSSSAKCPATMASRRWRVMISDVEGALPKSGALNLGRVTAAVVRIELEIWYTNFHWVQCTCAAFRQPHPDSPAFIAEEMAQSSDTRAVAHLDH
ncbi:hypothetical protein D9M71_742140 [compost metagenome]